MKRNFFVLFLIYILLWINCSSPDVEIENNDLNEIACIFFIYNNNSGLDFAAGYITKTFKPGEYDPHLLPLLYDADVYVNGTKMDTVFIDSLNFGGGILNRANFQLFNLNFHENDTIYLNIQLTEKQAIINGWTVIPKAIQNLFIEESNDYFFFELENFDSKNSYEYVIYEQIDGEFLSTSSGFVGNTDRIAVLKNHLLHKNSTFRIEIISYDANLTNYKLYKKDPSGLNGSYGIFFSQSSSLFEIKRPVNQVTRIY
jgi:hypothetical protein